MQRKNIVIPAALFTLVFSLGGCGMGSSQNNVPVPSGQKTLSGNQIYGTEGSAKRGQTTIKYDARQTEAMVTKSEGSQTSSAIPSSNKPIYTTPAPSTPGALTPPPANPASSVAPGQS